MDIFKENSHLKVIANNKRKVWVACQIHLKHCVEGCSFKVSFSQVMKTQVYILDEDFVFNCFKIDPVDVQNLLEQKKVFFHQMRKIMIDFFEKQRFNMLNPLQVKANVSARCFINTHSQVREMIRAGLPRENWPMSMKNFENIFYQERRNFQKILVSSNREVNENILEQLSNCYESTPSHQLDLLGDSKEFIFYQIN